MCSVFSKPSYGLLVREHNGDSCRNTMATGTQFINASPDGDLHPIIGQFRELKFPLLERFGFVANAPQSRSVFAASTNCAGVVDCSHASTLRQSAEHRQVK